jgi:hypothetical protein
VPVGLGALGVLVSATVARLLKHVRQPAVSSMSEEWLRQLDAQSYADDYSSRARNHW